MKPYSPPFDITNFMLNEISSISEKLGRINVTGNLETRPHLRRNNRIQSIHSSLKIEANSLSLGQVRDVLNGRLVLGEQREIQEVKNAFEAYERLSSVNPYCLEDLKKMHGIMTKYLLDDAGSFRQGEEGVFNGEQCIFMAPPARLVPQLMEELFEWMERCFTMNLCSFILFRMEMEEWQGFGIRLFLRSGSRFLPIFRWRARLRNFRRPITRASQNAMFRENPTPLSNLCWNRRIRSWKISSAE